MNKHDKEQEFEDHGFSIVDSPDEKISDQPIFNLALSEKDTIPMQENFYKPYRCNAKLNHGAIFNKCQIEVQKKGELCYYHQKKLAGLFN